MRIVVSGGGTGGHLMPVLALCQALRSQTASSPVTLSFIGTGDDAERVLVEAQGLDYYHVPSGKFRRYGRGIVTELTDLKTMRANARDAGRFLVGQKRARDILRELNPDVVFTKGSNPSVPVGLAAAKLGIPLVIHESDTVMGLANRILARKATAIATGFPVKHFDKLRTKAELVFTGSPIRPSILSAKASAADKLFKLSKLPVLLVIGGSNGAQPINQVIWESLSYLTERVQIIHQTGTKGFAEAQLILNSSGNRNLTKNYHPAESLSEAVIGQAYHRADIVISRCGANSLAELAVLHKPAILVPWPGSAGNHQVVNAAFFSHRGAARVIEQDKLTPHTLEHEVLQLLEHAADRKHLADTISQLAKPDAADNLARLVLKMGGHNA